MKKLTFMNIKGQELTRDELRNVMAGCGGSGVGDCPPGEDCYSCKCYGSSGYLGSVTCIGGNGFTCCRASFSNTTSARCQL